MNFQKTSKTIDLVISASQLEDSAVYFCALQEHTVRGVCGEVFQNPRALLHASTCHGGWAGHCCHRQEVARAAHHRWRGGGYSLTLGKYLSRFTDHVQGYHSSKTSLSLNHWLNGEYTEFVTKDRRERQQ